MFRLLKNRYFPFRNIGVDLILEKSNSDLKSIDKTLYSVQIKIYANANVSIVIIG